ncbi:Structural maintenance of chromosomes protein 1 AltName: Full=Chromosome segregation protein smc1; AltName: Full=Cohesin complex subunit psm1 [Serendipita indica DSM 11827]|nr:Structural maintenance of chromosomes protein 1 AltName: Full=Chromosome segregation protein smc1; AltName: Full=Cohesin complex subunit psm1 [Serendipita indica DSM 11827]
MNPPSLLVEEELDGDGDATSAWVLAVYVDEKGKEMRFKRTVSMAGSSEYRLNNKVVTHKTYDEALQSQNILVQAKNFLVFQGDVEAIASQSPKDLTKLIERISGSLELAKDYEEAKRAQDKATESSTFNFTKRRGIMAEIKQFKEQKTEADKFEKLLDERDELVIQRLLWRLYNIESTIKRNTQSIKKRDAELAGIRAELTRQEDALALAQQQQAKARSEVMKKEKAIKKQEKTIEAKKPALLAVETQITHGERKIQNAEKIAQEVKRDFSKEQEKLERLKADLLVVQKTAEMATKAQKRVANSSLKLAEGHLEEYQALKSNATSHAVAERQGLDKLNRDYKIGARSLATLQAKHDEHDSKQTTLMQDYETWKEKAAEAEEKVTKLKADVKAVKQHLDKNEAERTKITKLEGEVNEKLQNIHNQLLQASAEQRETERDRSFKENLQNLQRIFPGVRGRLVDLCKPSARKYDLAVSVVLGRNIDAIVVDTEKTCIECIEYMRNQRAGQATFIPLDTIKVKPINDRLRSLAKGARLAVEVVQCDPSVERAVHHACGNALICDTMDIAREVSFGRGQDVKAVSLDGTVIHKSGLMTGGRSTHNTGKTWEEREIQNLQRARDELLAQMRDLNKSKPRARADEGLTTEFNRLESALVIAREERASARSKVDDIKKELKHIHDELAKLAPQLKKANESQSAIEREMAKLQSVVDKAESEVFAEFCEKYRFSSIREYEDRQLKSAQEESEIRLRFDTQISRLTHQIRFSEEQANSTRTRLERLEEAASSQRAQLATLEAEQAAIKEEMDSLSAGLETIQEELKDLNANLEEKSKELDSAKKLAVKASKDHDRAMKEIASMNDEIQSLAMDRGNIYRKCRLEEVPLPLRQGGLSDVPVTENIRQEVGMDVDEEDTSPVKDVEDYGLVVDFSSVDADELENPRFGDQLDTKIQNLTAEIDHMAPNMKANERLGDVASKLKEAEVEAEQAKKASKAARDRFNEVRRERTLLFRKAFDHISDCIDKVYKDLTKGKAAPMGGVAYLNLEDNEEPYLGGITFHAMPPMKRFRDMDQLSGGEKTVAALALLFAIHSFQPSPFFVLDEVDAALDNTNVAKVANYIRQHCADTFQFIVISLKGSLYERSHSLVGIYRDQDVNSSSTLTLDLAAYDTQR